MAVVRRTANAMNNILKQRTWGENAKRLGYGAVVKAISQLGEYASRGATSYVGKRMAALNRQTYKKYRGPKRCRGTKRKASRQLTKTIKKVIRKEEKRDQYTGIAKVINTSQIQYEGYTSLFYQSTNQSSDMGLFPRQVMDLAAVLYNGKALASNGPSILTGNFATNEKYEVTSLSATYCVKNNTPIDMYVEMYVFKPVHDTDQTISSWIDEQYGSVSKTQGGVEGGRNNILFDLSDLPIKGSNWTYKKMKFFMKAGQILYRTIYQPNQIYQPSDHQDKLFWKGYTQLVAFRPVGGICIAGDTLRQTTRAHSNAAAGTVVTYQKLSIEQTVTLKMLEPSSEIQNG